MSSDDDNSDLATEDSIDEVVSKTISMFKGDKKNGKNNENIIDDGWCSDPVEDDDEKLLSVDGSDDYASKHHIYKEKKYMSNFKFMVGMKFKSTKEFKDVLSDVSVRETYEVLFYKNEKNSCGKKRTSMEDSCSVVMDRPTFSIKTLKGRHTCAKVPTNWLANYKFLTKKLTKL